MLVWGPTANIVAGETPASLPALFDATTGRTAADASAAQQAWAKQLGTNVIERNSVEMELVLIPPAVRRIFELAVAVEFA